MSQTNSDNNEMPIGKEANVVILTNVALGLNEDFTREFVKAACVMGHSEKEIQQMLHTLDNVRNASNERGN